MKLERIAACVWTIALAGCARVHEQPATEVLVVVNSDLEIGTQLTRLHVQVKNKAGDSTSTSDERNLALVSQDGQANKSTATYKLPLSFSVVPPKNQDDSRFRIVVTGLLDQQEVVEQQVIVTFQPGKTVLLPVFLSVNCFERLCRDEQHAGNDLICAAINGMCDAVPVAKNLQVVDPSASADVLVRRVGVPPPSVRGDGGDSGMGGGTGGAVGPGGGAGAGGRSTNTGGGVSMRPPGFFGGSGAGGTSGADTGGRGSGGAGTNGSGTGGAGGTSGASGTGGTGVGGPPCLKKANQVVLIGDAYINYTEQLAPRLETRASSDGALTGGQHYRDYASAGATLAAGTMLIAPQWDSAKSSDPDIGLVVMDGGGEDVWLQQSCVAAGSDQIAQCQVIVAAVRDAAATLLSNMKAAGVADAVYFFYPHVPAAANDITDYMAPLMETACHDASGAQFHCHFVDTRPAFEGHPNYISTDKITPSAAGSDALADLVWSAMKANCLAQPASSGCCAP